MNGRLLGFAVGTLGAVAAAAAAPGLRIGSAVRHGALEVNPVYGRTGPATANYLLLAEGLKSREVRIEERAGGGSVPELLLHNASRRPLLLVSGEVVYGGKQDRVIREDTIIPPMAKAVPLSVFCVERGRWAGGGKFSGVAGFATPKVLKAANFHAQADVWREVSAEARKARARGDLAAATRTETLIGVIASKQAAKDAAPFLNAAQRIFQAKTLPMGFVVAVGGKPVAAHLFASPGLAYKLGPKLLKSYALDAARSDARAQAAPRKALRVFLDEAMKDRGRVKRDLDAVQNIETSGQLGAGKATVDKKEGRTIHRYYLAH